MIRLMKPSDVSVLVALARDFFDSGEYWGGPLYLDENALAARLHAQMQNPMFHPLVAEKDGCAVGCLVTALAPDPLQGGISACKTQWIADPEHGRGQGLALKRASEKTAKACGAARIILGGMTDRVERLLEASGYTPVEKHYQKDL